MDSEINHKKTDGDVRSSIEPIDVEASLSDKVLRCKSRRAFKQLKHYQELFVDKDIFERSINVLRLCVLCNSVNATILRPNYAIMVLPNSNPDSFESTAPFDFTAANYFLPMCALLGQALSSTVAGRLSDKYGRKPVIMIQLILSGIGSMLKYFFRKSFWGFCIFSLFTGLFSSTTPCAMSYVADVFPSRKEKDKQVGLIIGVNMLGASGGGICAILLGSTGLFTPLWLGVALMFLSSLACYFYLYESKQLIEIYNIQDGNADDDDEEIITPPDTLDKCTLWHVIIGALTDNIGSSGLTPLCLSPLMFQKYYADFVQIGQTPIMTQNGYKWISVMIAIMVIPSTIICQPLYGKVGAAGACVFGNAMTGVVTIILLIISIYAPANNATFAVFVVILYMGFPLTVVSQLTTGPMLNTIAPLDKRGLVQGMNTSVMNFGMALSPWVLGIVADNTSNETAIWICIGVSFLASVINAPLSRKKGMGPQRKAKPSDADAAAAASKKDDDAFSQNDYIKKASKGEYVPAKILFEIKMNLMKEGKTLCMLHPGNYEDQKDKLDELRSHAKDDYEVINQSILQFLARWNEIDLTKEEKEAICKKYNASLRCDKKEASMIRDALGTWIMDYLTDSGYHAHLNTTLMKSVVMTAFPVITNDKEVNMDNFEEILLKKMRFLGDYIKEEQSRQDAWWDVVRHSVFASNINAR